ncbi:MAG: alpha/beta fold hydrolase [Geminicoccaceae bacterium]
MTSNVIKFARSQHSVFQRVDTSLLPWLLLCVILIQAGCATPSLQEPPDNSVTIAEFVSQPSTPGPLEGTYRGGDGAELGFLGYLAKERNRDLAFVYFHGIESHAGWFDGPARMLQTAGYDLFALDRRGSGINRENRGLPSGHIASKGLLISDVDAFIAPLTSIYREVIIIGLSWGGKLAPVYALSHPSRVSGLVLVTPGLKALVDVSSGTKLQILVSSWLAPKTRFKTPIEVEMFTNTPEHLDYIRGDELRLSEATAQFFMVSRALDNFVEAHIRNLELPVLLFLAGKDRIVDNAGVVDLLERADLSDLTIVNYSEQTHSIQFDAPNEMVDDILNWLKNLPISREVTSS